MQLGPGGGHLRAAQPDDPEPGPALLGDVVLCPAVAVRQGRAAGHSMDEELVLLATHGVLGSDTGLPPSLVLAQVGNDGTEALGGPNDGFLTLP